MVQKLQQYAINYAGELASLRVENEELRDTLTKENDKFDEISAEYYNRVSQMNKQIERLNSAVDVNEHNSSEILRKCQAYEDEIATIQSDADKKEGDIMRVVQVLVRTFGPLLRSAGDLLVHKKYLTKELSRVEHVIADCQKVAVVTKETRKNSRFRVAGIAIIAFNRLLKLRTCSQTRSTVSFNGIYLKMLSEPGNLKLPIFTNDFEILHSLVYSMDD